METKQQIAIEVSRKNFIELFEQANGLQIANNVSAAFDAVGIVSKLRNVLNNEVMNEVFMPLMNTKVGFLTDRTGKARGSKPATALYSIDVVRDCIIDAMMIGLIPTGNQFNIIAERMYPTKEGYTALLAKINVKYYIDISADKSTDPNYCEMHCKITYKHNDEKNSLTTVVTLKKDAYSTHDNLRGKADRRAKKVLYEYITGCDFGDADEFSSRVDSSKIQDAKTVLEIGTPEFASCVKDLANGVTIEQICTKFVVSDEVRQELMDKAMEGC